MRALHSLHQPRRLIIYPIMPIFLYVAVNISTPWSAYIIHGAKIFSDLRPLRFLFGFSARGKYQGRIQTVILGVGESFFVIFYSA